MGTPAVQMGAGGHERVIDLGYFRLLRFAKSGRLGRAGTVLKCATELPQALR